MIQNNSYKYLVNYISGLEAYKFSVQNITFVLDKENLDFSGKNFNISINMNQIATIQFIKSPFRMPNPTSPVNLNTSYSYFRIHYFDDKYLKFVFFMMLNSTTNSFNNSEEACKDLFRNLSNNACESYRIISPWGENKYDSNLLRIKKIYPMSYLGGHPQNHHKFSRIDFYILNDRFYLGRYINENNFLPFEIPFSRIKRFELTNRNHSSLLEKIFSLGMCSREPDALHIVFSDTNGIEISVYLSMCINGSAKDRLEAGKELLSYWQYIKNGVYLMD